jgi:hypothetical protein
MKDYNNLEYMQKLYDTPGVHLHHRQAAVIHADDLPSLAPQSRLRARCFPVCICIQWHTCFFLKTCTLIFSSEYNVVFRLMIQMLD